MAWQRLVGKVEFLGSFPGLVPPAIHPEVAFAGRSNVGKSSAINTLLNRKKAARVSGRPGRTQAVNLFNVGDTLCFADLPGYGFAKVPGEVRGQWKRLVESYLFNRIGLAMVVQLVDARHDAQKSDLQMIRVLREAEVPFVIVATKSDRLKRSKRSAQLKKLAQGLGVPRGRLLEFSSTERIGVDELWGVMLEAVREA